jgi:hypothetical protein
VILAAGPADLMVAVPVGSGMADDLPPGVHYTADGRVATVAFDGAGPDRTVMAELEARLSRSGLAITAHP